MFKLPFTSKRTSIISRLRKKYGGEWVYKHQYGWWGPDGRHVCWVGSVDEFDNCTSVTLYHYQPGKPSFVEYLQKGLDQLFIESKLQNTPDEEKIKQLLLNCLEHHYGSLERILPRVDAEKQALQEIKKIIDKVCKV